MKGYNLLLVRCLRHLVAGIDSRLHLGPSQPNAKIDETSEYNLLNNFLIKYGHDQTALTCCSELIFYIFQVKLYIPLAIESTGKFI